MTLSVEKSLPDAFGIAQAPRKTPDQLVKSNSSKAEEQLQKSKDFAIKMMLAEAKNSDPLAENSGSKGAQMLETANLIAQLDSAMVQVTKMTEMVEAVKNPGYNALELQGKEVSYDDSKRVFDGKEQVQFNYNINYPEEHNGGTVTTTIIIKDKDNKVVYETRGKGEKGDHKFLWDGRDKKGEATPKGTYSIEIKSEGSKIVGGKKLPFYVESSSTITDVVKSVEVQNGIVKKLILGNGKTIEKDQVISIKDIPQPKTTVKLSPELVGQEVELDLGRVQVISGNMDVYFNNHVKNPGKMTVEVFNEKGKKVKTLESTDIKKQGAGKITFSKTGLESGNYTVKVSVEDKDSADKPAQLEPRLTRLVYGIDYISKAVITMDDVDNKQLFKAHNIDSVVSRYDSPMQQRIHDYTGAQIIYDDLEFAYDANTPFAPEVIAKPPKEEGAIISHEELRIYNESNDIVATLRAEYEPFYQLDDGSALKMRIHMGLLENNFSVSYNDLLSLSEDKVIANRYIEQQLLVEGDAGYKFKDPETANAFKAGFRKLKFPAWDGSFGDIAPEALRSKKAENGQVFRFNRGTVYVKDDGSTFSGDPVRMGVDFVESVDTIKGELFLNLRNSKKTIREDKFISFVK
jgi:flagellar hook assembly protein FlgD